MGKFFFGLFVVVVASSPWVYLLLVGDFPGGNSELEEQLRQAQQDALADRRTIAEYEEKIITLENDIQEYRSKVQFLEETLAKTEGRLKDGEKDVEIMNQQIKELRGELSDAENRLLDETNRANTLEELNQNLATQLDNAIQEVRRLQTIIRTLSNE